MDVQIIAPIERLTVQKSLKFVNSSLPIGHLLTLAKMTAKGQPYQIEGNGGHSGQAVANHPVNSSNTVKHNFVCGVSRKICEGPKCRLPGFESAL